MNKIMKAVGFYEYLPITREDSFLDLIVKVPEVRDKELLVEVKAISINPIDTKVRMSKDIKEEKARIIGWDVSGTVVAVGEDCDCYKVGDEVFYAGDITKPGAYSEYHVVKEDLVGRKPKTISHMEAAALSLTSLAAYEALFERLNISQDKEENKDKTLLIINASGGVGSIAIQLAKYYGLTVIGTASRKSTQEWATTLGSDYLVNHHEDLVESVHNLGFPYVDYILCLHNTDQHWKSMTSLVAPLGSICSLVTATKALDMLPLKDKSASFAYEYMFTKAMFKKNELSQQIILNEIADLVDHKLIKTTINKHLSPINAETIKEAHRILESQLSIGKIVMTDFGD